jgi:RNA polymerase sigma factor (TIGR02999 family)
MMGPQERPDGLARLGASEAERVVGSDDLFVTLLDDLHHMATRAMAGERKDHTLQPTALLNMVWLRLFRSGLLGTARDRMALLVLADQAMRRILIEHGRRRNALGRYGRRERRPIDDVLDECANRGLEVMDVDEALTELGRLHERQAMVVSLRALWGFTVKEVAERLHVSEGTVENDFRVARAWLRRRLKGLA